MNYEKVFNLVETLAAMKTFRKQVVEEIYVKLL